MQPIFSIWFLLAKLVTQTSREIIHLTVTTDSQRASRSPKTSYKKGNYTTGHYRRRKATPSSQINIDTGAISKDLALKHHTTYLKKFKSLHPSQSGGANRKESKGQRLDFLDTGKSFPLY